MRSSNAEGSGGGDEMGCVGDDIRCTGDDTRCTGDDIRCTGDDIETFKNILQRKNIK